MKKRKIRPHQNSLISSCGSPPVVKTTKALVMVGLVSSKSGHGFVHVLVVLKERART